MPPSRSPAASPRLLLGLACLVFAAHAASLACAAEDAHITWRFARNLAMGHGFVWNVGEAPVEGFTSLLWVLISAAAIRLGLDVALSTQLLGTAAALGTVALTFAFARRHLGVTSWVASVPCFFLAVSGPLATWAPSGMEMTSFGFFVLLAVHAYLNHLERPSPAWLLTSGLSIFAATLLRPEGVMVFAVLAGMLVLAFGSRFRHKVVWGLAFLAPLGLYALWRLQAFEDPLPNTFYQKTGGGFWQHVRGVGYLINFSFFFLLPLVGFPALLLWERGLPALAPILSPRTWLLWAEEQPGLVLCVLFAAAWCVLNVYVGGDYMAMYRFLVPALPFVYLLLVPIVEPLRVAAASAAHKPALLVAGLVLAAGGTLVHSTPIEQSFYRKATWQHGNYRGVAAERRYVERFTRIGRFFEDYSQGAGESLATRSIGAIGWYAQRLAIHDLSGLTDRHIAHVPAKATAHGWAGHEKWDLDYSFGRLPTYFMLDEDFSPVDISGYESIDELADAIEEHYPSSRYVDWIRSHPDFIREHYRVTSVWLEGDSYGDAGWFAFLERVSPSSEGASTTKRSKSAASR